MTKAADHMAASAKRGIDGALGQAKAQAVRPVPSEAAAAPAAGAVTPLPGADAEQGANDVSNVRDGATL